LVESDGDMEVVGEAKNGRDAVRLALRLRPQVVLMDIAMPLLNGLQATPQIMESCPTSRVLILSANPDPEYVKQAMTVGASGYLIKQSSTQFVTQAVREVCKGKTYFSASISKNVRDECRQLFGKGKSLKKRASSAN